MNIKLLNSIDCFKIQYSSFKHSVCTFLKQLVLTFANDEFLIFPGNRTGKDSSENYLNFLPLFYCRKLQEDNVCHCHHFCLCHDFRVHAAAATYHGSTKIELHGLKCFSICCHVWKDPWWTLWVDCLISIGNLFKQHKCCIGMILSQSFLIHINSWSLWLWSL